VTPVVSLDVGADNGAGDVSLTVSQPEGYVCKTPIHVDAGGGSRTITTGEDGVPALPELTLVDGEDYWFDLSVRSPGLSDKLSRSTPTTRTATSPVSPRPTTSVRSPGTRPTG